MRSSITRAAAGAAVAAATVLALAGPASAATANPRVHTTLSIVESKNVINAGKTDKISGRLAAKGVGLAGKTVYLDRVSGKTLVAVQARLTGPAGGVAFTVSPGVTARYELVYLGNSVYGPTHSGIVTVRVILPPPPRVHTTLSIVESKNVIKAGKTDRISGRLAVRGGAGLAGRVVFLDRVEGKTLVQVQVQTTGPAGGVAFTVAPGVTARYELVYKGNAAYYPTHSGIVTVKVIA
jgi:hypothetical protein